MFSVLNKCGSAELFGPKLGSANFSTLAFGGRFRGSSTCLTAEGFPGSMLEWISNGLFGPPTGPGRTQSRSEEHTSELQSRLHLVCRLLLEKKKQLTNAPRSPCVHTHHS